MKLYMKVTSDEYELPLAIAESQSELARLLGVSASTVGSAISLQRKGIYANSSYKEVEVDDD